MIKHLLLLSACFLTQPQFALLPKLPASLSLTRPKKGVFSEKIFKQIPRSCKTGPLYNAAVILATEILLSPALSMIAECLIEKTNENSPARIVARMAPTALSSSSMIVKRYIQSKLLRKINIRPVSDWSTFLARTLGQQCLSPFSNTMTSDESSMIIVGLFKDSLNFYSMQINALNWILLDYINLTKYISLYRNIKKTSLFTNNNRAIQTFKMASILYPILVLTTDFLEKKSDSINIPKMDSELLDTIANIFKHKEVINLFNKHAYEADMILSKTKKLEELSKATKSPGLFSWSGLNFFCKIAVPALFIKEILSNLILKKDITEEQLVNNILGAGPFVANLVTNIIVDIFCETNPNTIIRQMIKNYDSINMFLEALFDKDSITTQDAFDAKALTLAATPPSVRLENVFVKYPNGKFQLNLRNKIIDIKPGEVVGIVGKSGKGKSTFLKALLRYMDPEEGSILINNQDIKKVTLASLRDSIAVVAQKPDLFERSIMENLRYGKLEASDEEVFEAAKKAEVHEFIMSLPNGYNTKISSYLNVSGGEAQRLGIARAFLKNSPILILDEATSALDSVTEATINKNLQAHYKGKTVFIVAHRLSTLSGCNKILVFDEGAIVEMGTEKELLEIAPGVFNVYGKYAQLWKEQNKEYYKFRYEKK